MCLKLHPFQHVHPNTLMYLEKSHNENTLTISHKLCVGCTPKYVHQNNQQ